MPGLLSQVGSDGSAAASPLLSISTFGQLQEVSGGAR